MTRNIRAAGAFSSLGGTPSWVLQSGAGVDATWDADFAGNQYWVDETEYSTIADFLTAIGGTFGRSGSNATFVNSSQQIEKTSGSNIPRLTHDLATGTALGYLNEEARTWVALHNRDLNNAVWNATNCTPLKDQTGVDGVSNSASSLLATAANGTCLQSITLSSSARFQTTYIKRITGSGTINMTMDNGSTWTTVTVTSSWTRVSVPTQTIANPIVGFRIVTDTDKIAIDYVGNENGTSATTAVEVTTVAITRAAEDLVTTFADTPNIPFKNWSTTVGTMYSEVTPRALDKSRFLWTTVDGNNNLANAIWIETQTDARINGFLFNGGGDAGDVQVGSAVTIGNLMKVAMSWKENDLTVSVDGAAVANDTTTNPPPTETRMSIACRTDNFGAEFHGPIARQAYWNVQLSDADLITVSTL